MTTAPEPRHETYEDVLVEIFEHTNLSLEARCVYLRKMDLAVGWELADELQTTLEFLASGDEVTRPPRMSREARRAALRRRRLLVQVLLFVAVSTYLTSFYALGLGYEALGWFGCAAAAGLAWMALGAEEGRA